jgi:hypothetical protein
VDPAGLFRLFEMDFDLADTRGELVKRIRWIIRIRFVVSPAIVLLMLFTGWQGWTQQQSLTRASLLAVLVTALIAIVLNASYHVALKRQVNLRGFVVLQLVLDVLLFTSYVYRSGGVTSPFTFLYLLPTIAAAMLVSGAAAALVAGLSSLCYSAIALLTASGYLDHISYFVALDQFARKWSYLILMILVNAFAFLAVATMTSFLMRAVRKKTESLTMATLSLNRKAHLMEMLYKVSRAAVDAVDEKGLLGQVGVLLLDGLALDRVLIYLVDSDGQTLVLEREFYGEGSLADDRLEVVIPLRGDAGVTANCALNREPENVKDPRSHAKINRELAEKIGINPFAVAPLVFRGKLLGVIGVDRKLDHGEIDDDAFQVLIAYADQAAVVLGSAQAIIPERQP